MHTKEQNAVRQKATNEAHPSNTSPGRYRKKNISLRQMDCLKRWEYKLEIYMITPREDQMQMSVTFASCEPYKKFRAVYVVPPSLF